MDWTHKQRPLVVISGPRKFSPHKRPLLCNALGALFETYSPRIRQGGAEGVDTFAREFAEVLIPSGWAVESDWKPRYGSPPEGFDAQLWKRVAPLRRTEDMLDGVNGPLRDFLPAPADVLVVFREGPELPTGGTSHAIKEARKRGIPIVLFEWPREEE